jgi:hypothetical protein
MDERMKRNALIVGALVLALLSIGAGALIALSSDNDRAESPSATPSSTTTPSPTDTPSSSSEPSETETPEPSESESAILEDGHHFVFVKRALFLPDGSTRVRFDLAYFLTGEEGQQAAEDHDDEFVNGYYIVNDNPRLRTLPLADDVEVEYVPTDQCCELQPGNIDAWLESINETNPTDYDGKNVPWWFTVEGGEITKIEQQWLP